MRLFAAISPPEELRARLISLQAGLPEGRLTTYENFHITLAFFGEMEMTQAQDLHAALGGICAESFAWSLDGVSVFGGETPRLIYARVSAPPALEALHEKAAQAGRGAGLEIASSRYTPHVTLKRLKRREMPPARLQAWLSGAAAFSAGPFRAERFGLYRSFLEARGPVYQEVASWPLAPG